MFCVSAALTHRVFSVMMEVSVEETSPPPTAVTYPIESTRIKREGERVMATGCVSISISLCRDLGPETKLEYLDIVDTGDHLSSPHYR